MTKEIKKCYKFLNLPYNASIDDLKEKERALIKDYKSREEKTGVDLSEDIAFVRIASDKIQDYISNNAEDKTTRFSTNWSEIGTLLFTLLVVSICAITCFIVLL